MEIITSNDQVQVEPENMFVKAVEEQKFIEANTELLLLEELRNQHLIPVFVKDNQPTISQAEFIDITREAAMELFQVDVSAPAIRGSHPIKGRIFEARHKKAAELQEHEKTIYYERMAFICEIPSILETVDGKEMALTIGGIKAYNQDNLNGRSGTLQKFRVFIGFKVTVCTNLCIWTDGYSGEIKARNLDDLGRQIFEAFEAYNPYEHSKFLNSLCDYELTQQQFATLVGKARMYHHLPKEDKEKIPELLVSDSQVSAAVKGYYQDENFCGNGSISLWSLYNLFTHAVKSSYVDSFLERNVNVGALVKGIQEGLEGDGEYSWFLE